MRCPQCGKSSTFEQDKKIKELYYCNYCHMWYVILPLSWQLPANPDILRMRKAMIEKQFVITQDETKKRI